MFCPNCGVELLENSQNFCHKCGTNIDLIVSKVPKYEPERIQKTPQPQSSIPIPIPQYRSTKPLPQSGPMGKYSKLCLGLSIGSLLIGIITFMVGYNIYRMAYFDYPPSLDYSIIGRLIFILLLRITGLLMGIFAKVYGVKAERFEPFNEGEKAGSTIIIFAILINALGIFLSFFGPLSTYSIPYY